MFIACPPSAKKVKRIVSYEQAPVLINEELVLATSLEVSNTNSLTPDYRLGKRPVQQIGGSSYIQTQISLSYYPSHNDILYKSIKNYTKIKLNFGGVEYDEGFVTSFSLTMQSNNLVKCQATISFFGLPKGIFDRKTLDDSLRKYIKLEEESKIIRLAHSNFSKLEQKIVDIPIQLNLSYSSDIIPVMKIGESKPSEYRFSKQQVKADIQCEALEKFVTLNGENASLKISLFDTCNNLLNRKEYLEYVKYFYKESEKYTCDGKITAANNQVDSENWIRGSIQIIQYI